MPVFPKLKIKPPKMAHHDRSHYFRTSFSSGPLYPIDCIPVNAGETHDLSFENLVNTQALLSPLYGSFRLHIDVFFSGVSLYVPRMWRNGTLRQLNGRLDANFPTFQLVGPQVLSTTGGVKIAPNLIDPSNLFSYLGFGSYFGVTYNGSDGTTEQKAGAAAANRWNAIPYLMYLDIYRHYFVNRQSSSNECLFTAREIASSQSFDVTRVQISELDDLFLNLPSEGGDIRSLLPSGLRRYFGEGSYAPDASSPYAAGAGFALRCYSPDRMNMILNGSVYDNNVTNVQVNTTGDSFTMDQFVTAKKLWNSRNKDVMTSGTTSDWIRSHFGVTPKISDDMPTYCGGTSSDIFFEDIRATTAAQIGDFTQDLGEKASTGRSYGSSGRFRITADRPGFIMVLASIVPKVDYFQWTDRYTRFSKLTDLFNPDFNGIGLQDVLVSDLTTDMRARVFPTLPTHPYDVTSDPFTQSVGKQPAYIEYMTAVDKIRGTMCTTNRSWVLSRDMRSRNGSSFVNGADTSAYVLPELYNQPFADQASNAENFLVQFYLRHHVRSSVLKRLLPYL